MDATQAKWPASDRLLIKSGLPVVEEFKFELQPVVDSQTGLVYAQEILFRGAILPENWIDVDRAVIDHLVIYEISPFRLFVNLSTEGLLTLDENLLIAAANMNDVVFELSELCDTGSTFKQVASKVNRLTAKGLHFALDDFGSGFDGLHRLYSMSRVKFVKVDGAFLKLSRDVPALEDVLRMLVRKWKAEGILTVAEWIESQSLQDYATDIGFDFLQGWHIDAAVAMSTRISPLFRVASAK